MSKASSARRVSDRATTTNAGRRRATAPAQNRKPQAEPKLLTRPEVAKALGVSERTARRMAGDSACPLGPGTRVKRTLYWTAESVEDARLWRVETGLAAAAPSPEPTLRKPAGRKQAPAGRRAKPAKTAKTDKAEKAEKPSGPTRAAKPKTGKTTTKTKTAKAKTEKPKAATAKAAATKPARTRAEAPKAGRPKAAKPKTGTRAKAATHAKPAAHAETPATPSIELDYDTLTALLPLLGIDPRHVPVHKRAALLRQAGEALGRHLGVALDAARREAGLRPHEPWSALSTLNRYEKSALDRSARIAAELVPARPPAEIVMLRRA